MTEEIKEIFRRMNDLIEHQFDKEYHTECDLFKDIQNLLDYITNLQQENEKLKYNARGQVNDYFKDKYADEVLKNAKLKEENKELNRMCELYSKSLYNAELTDYKSRFEKAIEYMKDFIFEGLLVQEDRKLIMYNENLRKFENILNGSDENE